MEHTFKRANNIALKLIIAIAILFSVFIISSSVAKAGTYNSYTYHIRNNISNVSGNLWTKWYAYTDGSTGGSLDTAYSFAQNGWGQRDPISDYGCDFSFGADGYNQADTWVSGNFYNGTPYLYVDFSGLSRTGYHISSFSDGSGAMQTLGSSRSVFYDSGMYKGNWAGHMDGSTGIRESGSTTTLTINWSPNPYTQTIKVYLQNADGTWGNPIVKTATAYYDSRYQPSYSNPNTAIYKTPTMPAAYTVNGERTTSIYFYRQTYTQTVNYYIEDASGVTYDNGTKTGSTTWTKVTKTDNLRYGQTMYPYTGSTTKYAIPEGHSLDTSKSSSVNSYNVTGAKTLNYYYKCNEYPVVIQDMILEGAFGSEEWKYKPEDTDGIDRHYEINALYGATLKGTYKGTETTDYKRPFMNNSKSFNTLLFKSSTDIVVKATTVKSDNTAYRYFEHSIDIDANIFNPEDNSNIFRRGDPAKLEIYTYGYIDTIVIEFAEKLSECDDNLNKTVTLSPTYTEHKYISEFNIPFGLEIEDNKEYICKVTGLSGDTPVYSSPTLIINGSSWKITEQRDGIAYTDTANYAQIFRDVLLHQS